jgi:uncharacterized protein
MNISGAATVHASPEAVWAALADLDLLVRAVPGLDQLDVRGDGRRQFVMTTAIAPVSGTYSGEASVVERAEPGLLVLHVSAAGARGTVIADVTVRFASLGDGGTELSYKAEVEVEGAIAGIGQRILASIGKRMAAEVISGIDAALAAGAVADDRLASAPVLPAAAQAAAAAGERVPALYQPGSAVRTGLVVGAAAGLTGILIGALLGRRSRAAAGGGR